MTRRVLCPMVLVVVLAGTATMVTATPVAASTVGVTVAGGNGPGSGGNQLAYPQGVAVDANRNVYIADQENNRVQRWAPGATVGVTVAGGNGPGSAANQLYNAPGVAVDGSGNVYVADYRNQRVQRWAPGATVGVTVAGGNGAGSAADQLRDPVAVAVDGSGNVYVVDSGNARVQRWAPSATSGLTVAGGNDHGSDANQLYLPGGLAVDGSRNVYVADFGNHRVQRWAPAATSGVTVAGGNGAGSAANQLYSPLGVGLDGAGNVYVADANNHRVQRWAPAATSGVTVAGGNGAGAAANQLNQPSALALDGGGDIYVSDNQNHRVQRWTNAEITPTVLPGVSSMLEGNAGATTLSVPVNLSNPSTQPVTAEWRTLYVSGAPGNQADPTTDYTPVAGTMTFNPGETDRTVTINVNGDRVIEPDEYIVVSFTNPTNAMMGGFWGLGFGTVVDDDTLPTMLAGGASVREPTTGTATVQVPVTLSQSFPGTVTAQWSTVHVSGAPGSQADPATDYIPTSGTITFGPGETSQTVSIPVNSDLVTEVDEYIVVSFSDPSNAVMGGFWGLGFATIFRESPLLTVAPNSGLHDGQTLTVSGSGFLPNAHVTICQTVEISSWGCLGPDVAVYVSPSGGFTTTYTVQQVLTVYDPLEGPSPFNCDSGSCSLAAWDISNFDGTFVSAPIDFPGPPVLTVHPSSSLQDGQLVTVTGSGFPPNATDIDLTECSGYEGDPNFFANSCNGRLPVTVDASGGFTTQFPVSARLFLPSRPFPSFYVDCAFEPCEIGAVRGTTMLVPRSSGTTTCCLGFTRPAVLPDSASASEGNSGTRTIDIPVNLSRWPAWDYPVTVQWTTLFVPGTTGNQAAPATDYTPASGTVTFNPGELSKTVSATINGDMIVEPDEFIVVSFHDPTNAIMGGFWGLGFAVIINDDG